MLEWMNNAACTGVDVRLFMSPELYALASTYCDICPVNQECHEYAERMAPYNYGTWAGVWYPGPAPDPEDYLD